MKFKLLFIFGLSALSIVHSTEDDATIISNSQRNAQTMQVAPIVRRGTDDEATMAGIPSQQNLIEVRELKERLRNEEPDKLTNEAFTIDTNFIKKLIKQAEAQMNFFLAFHDKMIRDFISHQQWTGVMCEITKTTVIILKKIHKKVCAFDDDYIDDITTVFDSYEWTRGAVDMIKSLHDIKKNINFPINESFMRTEFDWKSVLEETNGEPNKKLKNSNTNFITDLYRECQVLVEKLANEKAKLDQHLEDLRKKIDPFLKLSQQIRSSIQQIIKSDIDNPSTTIDTVSTHLRQLKLLIDNKKLIHKKVGKNNEMIPVENSDIGPVLAQLDNIFESIDTEFQFVPEIIQTHLSAKQSVFWQSGLYIFNQDTLWKVINDLEDMKSTIYQLHNELEKKGFIRKKVDQTAFIIEIHDTLTTDTALLHLFELKMANVDEKAVEYMTKSVASNDIIKNLEIAKELCDALKRYLNLFKRFAKSFDGNYLNHNDREYVTILKNKKPFIPNIKNGKSLKTFVSTIHEAVAALRPDIYTKTKELKNIIRDHIKTEPIQKSLIVLNFLLEKLNSGEETRPRRAIDAMKMICKQINDLSKKFDEKVPGESITWGDHIKKAIDELKRLADEIHKRQKVIPEELAEMIGEPSNMCGCFKGE